MWATLNRFSKTDGCNGPGMNGSHSIFSLGALFSLGLGRKFTFPLKG